MLTYLIVMGTFGSIYALLSLSLNMIWGMTGMINLGLVGFFAVGAYISALLTRDFGVPLVVGYLAAGVAAGFAGAVTAFSTVRMRGDYLAMVTLGFSEAVRIVASNEIWLTNGTDGISGIPAAFRSDLTRDGFILVYFAIVAATVLVVLYLAHRVAHSPHGRVLKAIRDDELVAGVAGKHVTVFKIQAFAVSSAIMGLAGALYGSYTSYISPDTFRPLLTIYIFLALSLGGTGNHFGATLGAFLVVFLIESTRFITEVVPGFSGVQVAALREFLIGASLILVLKWRPDGLLPELVGRRPRA